MSRLSKLLRSPGLFFSDAVENIAVRRQLFSGLAPWRHNPLETQASETPLRDLAMWLAKQGILFLIPNVDGGHRYNCLRQNLTAVLRHAMTLAHARGLEARLRVGEHEATLAWRNLLQNTLPVTAAPAFELTFVGDGTVLESASIDIWDRRERRGVYLSRVHNPYAIRLGLDEFERLRSADSGLVDLRQLYACPIDAACNFDVDVVYTWVNHADPDWRAAITHHKPASEIDWDRYHSSDELRYSMRSVDQYAPWVRTIYVVSNCSRPPWLAEHPRVRWVSHEEIFPSIGALPTFNSHAIEACLMNIDGLSECFAYFNDDCFLGRPTSKTSFFNSSGVSVSYLEEKALVLGEASEANPDYLNAAITGRKLIEQRFGVTPTRVHQHTPFALRRSVLQEMVSIYADAFARVRSSRFRRPNDISTASFLYHHHAYQTGDAVRRQERHLLINAKNSSRTFNQLLRGERSQFFCVNDGAGSVEQQRFMQAKNRVLPQLFPKPAPWEQG